MVGSRLLRAVLLSTAGLLAVAGAALLAVMSFLGVYLRPTSDDWCALSKTRDMGIFGIARHFYADINGRVANGFVNGLVNSHGLTGMKLFPTLLVVSLGLGLVLLLRQLLVGLRWPVPLLVLISVVAVVEVLLFAASRTPYQALLWAPGTISHTLPTIIAVWVVLFGLSAGRSARSWVRLLSYATVFATGIFLATLSEPAMIMAGLAAGAAGVLLIPGFRLVRNWYPFLWCASACLGLIAGFAILYTAPGWDRREAQVGLAEPQFSGEQVRGAFQDWVHVTDTVASQWTYLAALLVGVLAGVALAASRRDAADAGGNDDSAPERRPGRPRWLVGTALALPVPLLLVGSYLVILAARQGYGPSGYTYSRIWFNFLAPMVFTLTGYGILAGWGMAGAIGGRGRVAGAVGCLGGALAAGAFVFYAMAMLVPGVQDLTSHARARATAWDRQDEQIRREVARGATEVAYQPLYIGGLAEPFFTSTYSRDWAAACAANYYGVRKLNRPGQAG
jgi:hypothetical protein